MKGLSHRAISQIETGAIAKIVVRTKRICLRKHWFATKKHRFDDDSNAVLNRL